MESVTTLLARWPLIEPGGFATGEAAATIFREARLTLSTVDALLAALAFECNAALFTLDQDVQVVGIHGPATTWGDLGRAEGV